MPIPLSVNLLFAYTPYPFAFGDAPVPLYPFTPLGYGVIASGEGVRASPKAKGYGVIAFGESKDSSPPKGYFFYPFTPLPLYPFTPITYGNRYSHAPSVHGVIAYGKRGTG